MNIQRLLTACSSVVYAVVLSLFLFVSPIVAVGTKQARRPQERSSGARLSADVRAERGIFLLYPDEHSIVLQEWESVGIPRFDSLTVEKRLRLAIAELQIAAKRQKELRAYSLAQVYSHLGRAHTSLGHELQRQAEASIKRPERLTFKARKSLVEGINFQRLAFQHEVGELKYVFAMNVVKAIVSSGELNLALKAIRDFERGDLKPASYSDHGLIKMKADIHFVLGRYEEAGLAYEEWIRRGRVDSSLTPGNSLYDKLLNLQRRTGHPNNLLILRSTTR